MISRIRLGVTLAAAYSAAASLFLLHPSSVGGFTARPFPRHHIHPVTNPKTKQQQQPRTTRSTITTLQSHSVESTNSGPNGAPVHTLTIDRLPGDHHDDTPPIVIETGKLGRQAAGAVTLKRGDTVLYATASHDRDPKFDLDFLPLSVEHQERFSSVGTTSGSYNKRDGRPAEHEVLTCRLIDRPLRPLIDSGWRHETQLLSWVLSYDGERNCDPLAIIASSAALYLSDVPIRKAVAGAMVGYNPETDELLLNPTNDEMANNSTLHLIVAGTKDAVLMIEGAAAFLPEEIMIRAVEFGHKAIQAICHAVEDLGEQKGIDRKVDTLVRSPPGLQEKVDAWATDKIDALYDEGGTKTSQGPKMKIMQNELVDLLSEGGTHEEYNSKNILGCYKDLLIRRIFHRASTRGIRTDGRKLTEIRHLSMEAGLLPRTHGSALFTRGETQVLATTTLGGSGMKQKIDKIDGMDAKRFYLQYTFPPSCVGETGRVGAPGRREVGHGNLAERALAPTLPDEEGFPYAIRVESMVTESHGSSSMASVCGGCLALMDAGVPIKSPVAGIAMGMLLDDKSGVSDENAVILSDILGSEDALGTMDFKVAGDRKGITTFQLDIKCEGLSLETMARALEQARVGRLHILDAMAAVLPETRDDLPDTVPKMLSFSIPPEAKGRVIGPGGKQIRAVIEDFELSSMDLDEEGKVQISSFSSEKMKEAQAFVEALVGSGGGGRGGGGGRDRTPYAGPEPVEGALYKGKITGIHNFGVFLEFMPGAEDGSYPALEGLCHVSELARDRIRNCEGFVKSMNTETMEVKYLGLNDKGKRSLSRKRAIEDKNNGVKVQETPAAPSPPPVTMPEEELDVIAKAIEGVE